MPSTANIINESPEKMMQCGMNLQRFGGEKSPTTCVAGGLMKKGITTGKTAKVSGYRSRTF